MMRLRRGMVRESGRGWAVVDGTGKFLPGRWENEETAREQGLLGVYLLSGVDVVFIRGYFTQTKAGFTTVFGSGESRHDSIGTVEKVYGGYFAVSAAGDTRMCKLLREGCEWLADQSS